MAIMMAKRSDDSNTQCGCVLVDSSMTVLSTGFNGFVRGFDEELLPNVRCEDGWKNHFMIHAEHNALLNCARQGKSTLDSIAYITGLPCNWCLQYMLQSGVKSIVFTDYSLPAMCTTDEFSKIRDVLNRLSIIDWKFIPKELLNDD